jgi:protein-tyrosine phosphatase
MGSAIERDNDSTVFVFPTPQAGQEGMDRYSNVKPWAHNRVKLQVSQDSLDYVNASPIVVSPNTKSSLEPLRYIAMQGPTPRSRDFVWRMVAEQLSNPVVIVQLTNMMEGGAVKCSEYFPHTEPQWQLNKEDSWNDSWTATLRHEETEVLLDGAIEKRKLVFCVEGEADDRIVWHFLYTRWPDFGVPVAGDVESFLELMRLSREYNTTKAPRIIHCSAGVGRTGTFIALEHLIRELEAGSFADMDDECHPDEDEFDPVFVTVDRLRQQRKMMVQNESQLYFIYRVLHELWIKKYHPTATTSDDGYDDEPAPKRQEV